MFNDDYTDRVRQPIALPKKSSKIPQETNGLMVQ